MYFDGVGVLVRRPEDEAVCARIHRDEADLIQVVVQDVERHGFRRLDRNARPRFFASFLVHDLNDAVGLRDPDTMLLANVFAMEIGQSPSRRLVSSATSGSIAPSSKPD